MAGSCVIADSTIEGGVAVYGNAAPLDIRRSQIGPSTSFGYYAIYVEGRAPVTVNDSMIRNVVHPLYLRALDTTSAGSFNVRRTRFVDNIGPMMGDRRGIVTLEDVEIRDHVTTTLVSSVEDFPAVLIAQTGPLWRFDRALIVGNRGGGTDGAAIRLLPGGRVGVNNSTLYDNTFRADVVGGFGHTIGIYAGPGDPVFLSLSHSTLNRASSLASNATGSLLTVRGSTATVQVINSLLRGTCAFSSGGAVNGAVGSAESPGTTCQFTAASNFQFTNAQLRLGPLQDNGGFTHSFMPIAGSSLLDVANSSGCQLLPRDQRSYLRPTNGVGCDIGAVEQAGINDRIFVDGLD